MTLGFLICALFVSPTQADPYRWCAEDIGDSGQQLLFSNFGAMPSGGIGRGCLLQAEQFSTPALQARRGEANRATNERSITDVKREPVPVV
jgi:hypothetical protein